MSDHTDIPNCDGYHGQDVSLLGPDTISTALKIEHVMQSCNWTCGPACFRSTLKTLCGLEVAESELIARFHTNSDVGTLNETIEDEIGAFASDYSLEAFTASNGTLDDLRRLVGQSYIVMLSFLHPEDGVDHFALAKAISSRGILTCDPFSGPDCVMSFDPKNPPWFDWRRGETRGWYAAFRRT